MPDTEENRKEYPLTYNQKPGTGFPVARIGAIISLSCGAILNLGICRYAGKGQSELGMLRKLWDVFRRGDVLVADRLMCAWTEMVMLQQRGVDCVFRLTSHRTADFRRGMRLGKDDHIVKWMKPTKPRSIDRKTYDALPEFLLVRECRIRIERPGFRVRCLVIATTLLNADEYTKDDLAQVYRARWNEELDLRSIKITMQMDLLRCKTPELVRKEIWTHVLAYNLIRTIMAQAASQAWNRAAIHQFQGDAPSAGGLSAGDRPASTSWSRAPEVALSANVAGHRPAPRRRSPRPLRASHDQTQSRRTTTASRSRERRSNAICSKRFSEI